MNDFRTEFNAVFLTELQQLIQNAGVILNQHQTKAYTEYIAEIASNGKRIRPYNVALTYTVYSGKDWTTIKSTLIGVELIHLMALIHDDIMDNSETRHGVASVHSHIKKDLVNKTNKDAADHTSRSIGILLGDLIFAWAYAEFSKDAQTEESWSVIHSLVQEVVLGQMMDVYNPIETKITMEAIERKMLLKTGRYTFTRPLLLGAACAGAPTQNTQWLVDFGDAVGLLFQMQDDIFDITKDVAVLKKNPLGDIKNGIHTMLSEYVMQNAREEERARWLSWFGNENIDNQEEIKLFTRSIGALDFGEQYVNEKERLALEALSRSNLNEEDSEKYKSLLSAITKRNY